MTEASGVETNKQYETLAGSIEKPMLKICQELQPNFEEGDYGMIIGDDTSARLPTLAMRGVVNYIYEKRGREVPKTIFLQAGTKVEDSDLNEQFNARIMPLKDQLGGRKALIVTEHIQSGETIRRLMNIFNAANINIDVAALRTEEELDKSNLDLPQDSKLVVGEVSIFSPSVWRNWKLTGISRKYDWKDKIGVIKRDNLVRKRVLQARGDVQITVEKIISELYPNSQVE